MRRVRSPTNRHCADCGGALWNQIYCVLPAGAFICVNCARVHARVNGERRLAGDEGGVLKSVRSDAWSAREVPANPYERAAPGH